jgi:tetratricopeptide (TPR) repeat protein
MSQLPHNPYIAGRALADARGFYGRADILRVAEIELSDPNRNALVLFGQRRIGKTSILLQLQHRLAAPRFLPVLFDLQDRARQPLGQLLADLAGAIAEAVEIEPGERSSFDDLGVTFRNWFLPRLYAALAPEQRPILLFDEFDVLDVAVEEHLPPNSAARAFFPYLRELLVAEPRLGFVFVLGRRISDLSNDIWATFKSTRSMRVSVLEQHDARALILSAEQEQTLSFTPEAVDALVALTSGHPYLTQLVCQIIWDNAHLNEPADVPQIGPAEVEQAAHQALEAGNNVFVWIWNGLPPAERIIAAAIAEATATLPEIAEDELVELLQSRGVRIFVRELETAPKMLVEWELLRRTPGGYRFLVELLRRWVVLNKPLAQVREEIDRINPLADVLYRAAEWYVRQRAFERAQGRLSEALNVNPNHLKARLLLGEVLIEQGKLARAVNELEEAYRYDPAEARLLLVRALLAHGEERERAGAEEEALVAYDRALQVSSREKVARDRRAAILIAQGDQLLGEGDFEGAELLYRQADSKERLLALIERREEQEIEALVEQAERDERLQEWETAAGIYRRLAETQPGEKRWQEGLARIRHASDLARTYAEGRAAEAHEDWGRARQAYATVVAIDPDYADAADRLAAVVKQRRNGITPPEGQPVVSGGRAQPMNDADRRALEQLLLNPVAPGHHNGEPEVPGEPSAPGETAGPEDWNSGAGIALLLLLIALVISVGMIIVRMGT